MNVESEFVSFFLSKYNISCDVQVIHLKWKEWKALAKDRFAMDNAANDLFSVLENNKSLIDLDEELKNMVEEIKSMEKTICTEYTQILSLQDHLGSVGMHVAAKNMSENSALNDSYPFIKKVVDRNKDKDMIIILNDKALATSRSIKRETLVTIAHELFHLVEILQNSKFDMQEIERLSYSMYREFLSLNKSVSKPQKKV